MPSEETISVSAISITRIRLDNNPIFELHVRTNEESNVYSLFGAGEQHANLLRNILQCIANNYPRRVWLKVDTQTNRIIDAVIGESDAIE